MSASLSASATPAAPVVADPTAKRLCPGCLGLFRVQRGLMVRHGFSALNIRHGESNGYHLGRCAGAGQMPIGTAGGNGFALRLAVDHLQRADHLASLPEVTTQQAIEAAVREAQKTVFRRRVPTAEERALYSTPAAFADTSARSWFWAESIEYRRKQLVQMRVEAIEQHKRAAADLRAAVAAHPVEG